MILGDISSSDLDGTSLVRDLSAHFPTARVVLIGDQIPNTNIYAMPRAGTVHWLQKPVDPAKLAEVPVETPSRRSSSDAEQRHDVPSSRSQ